MSSLSKKSIFKNKNYLFLLIFTFITACNQKSNNKILVDQKLPSPPIELTKESNSEYKYEIDEILEICCTDSSSNFDIKKCTVAAINNWEIEMNKYYELLFGILNGDSKLKLIESQKVWELYSQKELKLNHAIYNLQDGTIWGLISLEQTMEKIKERALHLKTYYDMITGEGLKG